MKLCKVRVAPFTGAWIEISSLRVNLVLRRVAPFTGAWIEMKDIGYGRATGWSLPSRERGLKSR